MSDFWFRAKEILRYVLTLLLIILIIEIIVISSISTPYILLVLQIVVDTQKLDVSNSLNYVDNDFILSIFNAIITAILSYLVYKLNRDTLNADIKQSRLNIVTYFEVSFDSIEKYLKNLVGNTDIFSPQIPIYMDLIKIKISCESFELLKDFYLKIENVRKSQEQGKDNLQNLCQSIVNDKDYLKVKKIVKKIKRKYR